MFAGLLKNNNIPVPLYGHNLRKEVNPSTKWRVTVRKKVLVIFSPHTLECKAIAETIFTLHHQVSKIAHADMSRRE